VPSLTLYSKFFGKPNGKKVPAKQSTLSFSVKSNTKNDAPTSSAVEDNEDSKVKDEDSDIGEKPVVEKVEKVEKEMFEEKSKNGLPLFFHFGYLLLTRRSFGKEAFKITGTHN